MHRPCGRRSTNPGPVYMNSTEQMRQNAAIIGWNLRRTRDLLATSRRLSRAAAAQVSTCHNRLEESRELLRRTPPRFPWMQHESREAADDTATMEVQRKFPAVATMIADAEQAAALTADPIATLGSSIRSMIAAPTDPYLLIGVLLEGMVQTLARCIPPERQVETVAATSLMLRTRLKRMLPR